MDFIRIITFVICVATTGCGSSEQSDNQYEVTLLGFDHPRTGSEYYEGQAVRVRFLSEGDTHQLTYHWHVEFDGSEVNINGQGTSEVLFIAPETNYIDTVGINLEIDSTDTQQIGSKNYDLSLIIKDSAPMDPANLVTIDVAHNPALPGVSSIDKDLIQNGSTWLRKTVFESSEANNYLTNTSALSIAHIVSYKDYDPIVVDCLSTVGPNLSNVALFPPSYCDSPIVTEFFQSEQELRLSASCETRMHNVSFVRVSDQTLTNFGEIDLSIGDDISIKTKQVCGYAIDRAASKIADENGDGYPDNEDESYMEEVIQALFNDEVIQLDIKHDELKHFDINLVGKDFDPDAQNALQIRSSLLPNGLLSELTSGRIEVTRNPTDLLVNVDVKMRGENEREVPVKGTIRLNFEFEP